jgi:hypothetical protein
MENALIWIGWIVSALLLAPLLLGTPLVKKTHWIAKKAKIKAWDPNLETDQNLEKEIREWLDSRRPDFEALGFQFVTNGILADFTPLVTTYFSLFRHSESGLAGTATWISSPQKQLQYSEFSQLFGDGTSLNVNNSVVSLTWRFPEKKFYRFPWQTDLKRLFELHQFIRKQKLADKTGLPVVPGKELQTVSDFIAKEGLSLISSGAYQIGKDPDQLVLTWAGAVNAVWANAFPGKQLFAQQELGQSRLIEKEYSQSQMG